MDGHEIELKLALPSSAMARLPRLPLLRLHRQGRATSRLLTSVYWDTPDLALARSGITLRIRTDGKSHRQTVKTSGNRAAGLFTRREWEVAVPGDAPDFALLHLTGLPELADETVTAALVPVFTTTIRRTIRMLAGEGWRVEMAVDAGEVAAGGRREPISEVELELLEGRPADLFALARAMAEAVPVRVASQSKSDRGYQLAGGKPPGPVKARSVTIDAEMPVAAAFQAIARNCLDHLLANEPGLLANRDGEAIHQMRVALRRLRSALKVFRPVVDGAGITRMRDDLRWLLSHLGPARDGDVFLAEIVDPVMESHPGNPALAKLRRQWQRLRDEGVAAAVAAVDDRRFTAIILDLGAWIEAGDWLAASRAQADTPVGPYAARRLAKTDARLREAAGKSLDRLPPQDLHRLRILGKQLRYAGEFFAPLYPRRATRAFLDRLAELQDTLGEINDLAVAAPRLSADAHVGEEAWAAGLIAGWHEARRPVLLQRAQDAWTRWRKAERFWS